VHLAAEFNIEGHRGDYGLHRRDGHWLRWKDNKSRLNTWNQLHRWLCIIAAVNSYKVDSGSGVRMMTGA
jgi:hypothetical protein